MQLQNFSSWGVNRTAESTDIKVSSFKSLWFAFGLQGWHGFLTISQVWSFEHAGFSGFQDTIFGKKVDLVACGAAQIVDATL